MAGTNLVVCEHQIVPQDCPYCELKRLRGQRDALLAAAKRAVHEWDEYDTIGDSRGDLIRAIAHTEGLQETQGRLGIGAAEAMRLRAEAAEPDEPVFDRGHVLAAFGEDAK